MTSIIHLLCFNKLCRCTGTAWQTRNTKYCTWKGLQ